MSNETDEGSGKSIILDLELAPYEMQTQKGILNTIGTNIEWEITASGIRLPNEDDSRIFLYPELGEARFYRRKDLEEGIILTCMYRKWRVKFTPTYTGPPDEQLPDGGTLQFDEAGTNESETPWKKESEAFDEHHWWPRLDEYTVKLFGQPDFKQQELALYMRSTGHVLPTFIVFYDGWGDMGNWNVFVDFTDDGTPIKAFFEYSCG